MGIYLRKQNTKKTGLHILKGVPNEYYLNHESKPQFGKDNFTKR